MALRGLAVHPATSLEEARRLNLELCSHHLTSEQASNIFGVDASALPSTAGIFLCQRRDVSDAGMVYIRGFMTESELHELHVRWPANGVLYGQQCEKTIGELASFVKSPSAIVSEALDILQSFISSSRQPSGE